MSLNDNGVTSSNSPEMQRHTLYGNSLIKL